MTKIVQVANAMLSNSKLIQDVEEYESEYLFRYKQYVWSIRSYSGDNYLLRYYPGVNTVSNALDYYRLGFALNVVQYDSKELGTREAKSTLSELYTFIKEKAYGLDEVFDDILKDSEIPF